MKRLFMFFVVLCLLSSCSKEKSGENNTREKSHQILCNGKVMNNYYSLSEDKNQHIVNKEKSSHELLSFMENNKDFVLHIFDEKVYIYKDKSDFFEQGKFVAPKVLKYSPTSPINGVRHVDFYDNGDGHANGGNGSFSGLLGSNNCTNVAGF